MNLPDILTAAAQLGVLATLNIFFVWETSRREARLATRIGALEALIETRLATMVTDTQAVLRDATRAIENNNHILIRMDDRIAKLENRTIDG